jgi:geranylgeranyl pyrophosphate synthase
MRIDPISGGFLGRVEKRLSEALDGTDAPPLLEAARHLILAAGAKRVRPLLVLHSGRIFREDDPSWLDVAVAAELIHSASLLHDDVVDDARLRRNLPTANVKWGNTVAILSGDLLLSLALRHLRGVDPAVVQEAIETVGKMTQATIGEVQSRGRLDLTFDGWRDLAAGKTGSLFAWCSRAAVWGEADADSLGALSAAVERFAVAFQLLDDLKDVVRTASGKDRLSDLRNKEPNAAVILALEASDGIRDALRGLWDEASPDPGRVGEMASRIASSGAVDRALALAREEVSTGIRLLGDRRKTPGGAEIARWAEELLSTVPAKGDA